MPALSYSTVETRHPELFRCHQELCPAARGAPSSSCAPEHYILNLQGILQQFDQFKHVLGPLPPFPDVLERRRPRSSRKFFHIQATRERSAAASPVLLATAPDGASLA